MARADALDGFDLGALGQAVDERLQLVIREDILSHLEHGLHHAIFLGHEFHHPGSPEAGEP